MSKSLLIKAGNIFLGTSDKDVMDNAFILVRENKILYVGDKPPSGEYDIMDLDGFFVMPGMIDLHVHLSSSGEPNYTSRITETTEYQALKAYSNAEKALQSGFTTLRDVGASGMQVISLKKAINSGLVQGPRIFAAGRMITETGGHGDTPFGSGRVCDGADEVRKAVREQIKAGADLIKLSVSGGGMSPQDSPDEPQFTVEEISVAVQEAHSKHRRVAAHAQSNIGIKNALRAGVDTIEHALYLDEESCKMIVAQNRIIVPTMISPFLTATYGKNAGVPEWALAKTQMALEPHKMSVNLANNMGVKIGFGTDAGTPFNYHGLNGREFECLVVRGGLTPGQALYAATGIAAEALGKNDSLGTISAGKLADIIAINGNPLTDIKVLADPTNVRFVMLNGQVVKSAS